MGNRLYTSTPHNSRALCPKCTENVPRIDITDDKIKIDCRCGCKYFEEISLSDYLNQYNNNPRDCTYNSVCKEHNEIVEYFCYICHIHFCDSCEEKHLPHAKTPLNNKDIVIDSIKKEIQKGEAHLKYLALLKQEMVNKLNNQEQINQIEASYTKCYNTNKDVLTILTILTDNYIIDNYFVIDNLQKLGHCNVYKPIDKEFNTIINYFNSFHFTKVKEVESVKISFDFFLDKYNKIDPYFKEIKSSFGHYTFTFKLDDHRFALSDFVNQNSLYLYTFNESTKRYESRLISRNAHCRVIIKVVLLSNDRIASVSEENVLKIWNINPNQNPSLITKMNIKGGIVESIYYMKEKDVLLTFSKNHSIIKYNMKTYQFITVISLFDYSAYMKLDENRVIITDGYYIYILNADTTNVEYQTNWKMRGYINTFIKLRDNKTFLFPSGDKNGEVYFYLFNSKTKEYGAMCTSHTKDILSITIIDDNTFASYGKEYECKTWKY